MHKMEITKELKRSLNLTRPEMQSLSLTTLLRMNPKNSTKKHQKDPKISIYQVYETQKCGKIFKMQDPPIRLLKILHKRKTNIYFQAQVLLQVGNFVPQTPSLRKPLVTLLNLFPCRQADHRLQIFQ